MGPQRRVPGRRTRTVLSTAAWLLAISIFTFVSWFYVIRHDDSSVTRQLPPLAFEPVTEKDDTAVATGSADITSSGTSSLPSAETLRINSSALSDVPIVFTASSATMSSPSDAMPTVALTTPPEPLPLKPGGATVKLRQGTYVGATIEANPDTYPRAVDAFMGIPYAQSTAGENRFRPAVPVADSTSTFQAASYGHACLGANSGRPEGEDCLNANVFRPRDGVRVPGEVYGVAKPSHLLPVVVYVHGGGFNAGHGGERNMTSFVSWAKEDIVAVSFNYRVGAFGFLPSALTAREGLLNLGLRDQQALFVWVQNNIAAFEGDPSNVTVMGLSAGAHSIGHHLMHYARESTPAPFVKAILESGATTARATFYPTHPRHLVQFREFLIATGIEGVPESDIFPTLRTLPAATILKASKALWDKYVPSVTWPFQPVIDGPNALSNSSHSNTSSTAAIPDLPLLSWQQGHHLSIPVLTGFNTNEGTLFIPAKANTSAEFRAFFSTLIPGFGPADLGKLESLYPDPVTDPASPYKSVPPGMGAQWARLDAAYSHYAYICPVLQTAHFLSASSPDRSSSSASSFSKSAHNSYGLRSTVGEAPSSSPAAQSSSGQPASDGDPSTAEAHNSYGLRSTVAEHSSPSSAGAPSPKGVSDMSSSTEQAHNSYGLARGAGELSSPFSSSSSETPSVQGQSEVKSTAAEAHNSYGIARRDGKPSASTSTSSPSPPTQRSTDGNSSNAEAHNSYGLSSGAREVPSSSSLKSPPLKGTPDVDSSTGQAHNSYGLRTTVREQSSSSAQTPPARRDSDVNPSTAEAHNSYGLARRAGELSGDSSATASSSSPKTRPPKGTPDVNPSTAEAHNSYGLRSTVGEPSSSPKKTPPAKGTSDANPSTAEAHNSYGLAQRVGEASPATAAASSSPGAKSPPVYVYRYAAASKWGTANHGDEAPVVAHDMLVISPPSPASNGAAAHPGLMRVADAMHAAWVNFIVSPSGNPNPVDGRGEGEEWWPVFVSPLASGGAETTTQSKGGKGQIVVFGEGNDERDPESRLRTAGTPVRVESLSEWDLERCRFWWERVELSEGVGKRLDRGKL